jgi:hypothetical protein
MDHSAPFAQIAGDLLLRQIHDLQQVTRSRGLFIPRRRIDGQHLLVNADLKETGSSGCAPPAAG